MGSLWTTSTIHLWINQIITNKFSIRLGIRVLMVAALLHHTKLPTKIYMKIKTSTFKTSTTIINKTRQVYLVLKSLWFIIIWAKIQFKQLIWQMNSVVNIISQTLLNRHVIHFKILLIMIWCKREQDRDQFKMTATLVFTQVWTRVKHKHKNKSKRK